MTPHEYQVRVQRTCATSEPEETMKLALIGMQGELGEIAEPLKKYLYSGHTFDTSHLEQEIGDFLWYLATLCNSVGIDLAHAMQQNIAKLAQRYPEGFSCARSIERWNADDPAGDREPPHPTTPARSAGRLLTIGYSEPDAARQIEAFLDEPGALLVDIRYSPWSRWNPAWRKASLRATYRERYVHIQALGNVNYNQLGKPIHLLNPGGPVQAAAQFLHAGGSLLLLCACKDYDRCHRKVVFDLISQALRAMQETREGTRQACSFPTEKATMLFD